MSPIPITIKKRISDDVKYCDEKTGEIILISLYMDPMLKTKDSFIIADPSLFNFSHQLDFIYLNSRYSTEK